MNPLAVLFIALAAAGIGALLSYLVARLRAAGIQAQLQSELASARTAIEKERENATAQAQNLEDRFKQLAQEILEDKSKRFTDQNRDNLEQILKPLREHISGFEKQVKETYDMETRDRVALFEQVRALQALNQQVTVETKQLTEALKGQSKTQGNWGEMVLARTLELSGLAHGREYDLQVAAKTADGKTRFLDALVRLPDGRHIVVDSKVSLNAYLRSVEAGDELARRRALDEHCASLRAHVQGLASKEYQRLDGIQSLDFVVMFVPNEAGYVEALRHDGTLFVEAFEKKVVLVSPTSLLPTLRAVESTWKLERQTRNAEKIAQQAGAMYDQFVLFEQALSGVGDALDRAQDHYELAHKRLASGRGNLVRRAEQLRELGAANTKKLPEELTGDTDESPAADLARLPPARSAP